MLLAACQLLGQLLADPVPQVRNRTPHTPRTHAHAHATTHMALIASFVAGCGQVLIAAVEALSWVVNGPGSALLRLPAAGRQARNMDYPQH